MKNNKVQTATEIIVGVIFITMFVIILYLINDMYNSIEKLDNRIDIIRDDFKNEQYKSETEFIFGKMEINTLADALNLEWQSPQSDSGKWVKKGTANDTTIYKF